MTPADDEVFRTPGDENALTLVEVAEIAGGELTLRFDATGEAFDAALAQVGAMPLPPYIAALRAPDEAVSTYDYVTADWARRWPAEEAWKVRKTG